MLGGVCAVWLVLFAPSESAPRDPFADASRSVRELVAVRGDLVDPFSRPAARAEVAPIHRVRSRSFDLKDPFAPPSSVGRRHEPGPRSAPDLADPFAHPVAVSTDEPPCAAVRASNGARVQRPEGLAPPRCVAPAHSGPRLRNPFD